MLTVKVNMPPPSDLQHNRTVKARFWPWFDFHVEVHKIFQVAAPSLGSGQYSSRGPCRVEGLGPQTLIRVHCFGLNRVRV